MRRQVLDVFVKVVWVIFIVIVTYLMLASVFSTSFLGEVGIYNSYSKEWDYNFEHSYFIRDAWWLHLLVFMTCSVGLYFMNMDRNYRGFEWLCGIVIVLFMLLILLFASTEPASDSAKMMRVVAEFEQGNYSSFDTDQYMFRYPFQYGIVSFYLMLSKIFGMTNYFAFRLFNLFFIGATYFLLLKILKMVDGIRNIHPFLLLGGIAFTPYFFYVTLIYGNVIGFFLAVCSFYFLLKYDNDNNWIDICISILTILLAMILKSNCKIFFVAELIVLFFGILKNRNNKRMVWQRALIILCMLVGLVVSSKVIEQKITNLAGERVEGMPMISWVAMGMIESDSAPGWYNGASAGLYINNNFDYDATVDESIVKILEKVKRCIRDPEYFVDFFSGKILSMWNNPQFQCLRMIDNDSGTWWDCLFENEGRFIFTWINNIVQSWILIGVFLYAILSYKGLSYKQILLPISIVGGFVFHIFWEAKCMYAMPYFVLMIPLCISGYTKWSQYLKTHKGKVGTLINRIWICVAVICLLSYTDVFGRIVARNEDTTRFNTYTQERVLYDREEFE